MAESYSDRDGMLASLPVGKGYPLTHFIWEKMYNDVTLTSDNEGSGQSRSASFGNLLILGDEGVTTKIFSTNLRSATVAPNDNDGVTGVSNAQTGESSGALKGTWQKYDWNPVMGVHRGIDDRSVWLRNVKEDAPSPDPVTDFGAVTGVGIGSSPTTGVGHIRGTSASAWFTMWGKELVQRDADVLYHGVNPFVIEHDDLIFFAPLYGNNMENNDALPYWGKDHNQTIDDFLTYTTDDGDGEWDITRFNVDDCKIDTVNNRFQLIAKANGQFSFAEYYPRGNTTPNWPSNSISDTFNNAKWIFSFKMTGATMPTSIDGPAQLAWGIGNGGNYPPNTHLELWRDGTTLNPDRKWEWIGIIISANDITDEYEIWISQRVGTAPVAKHVKFDHHIANAEDIWVDIRRHNRRWIQVDLYSSSQKIPSNLIETKYFAPDLLCVDFLRVQLSTYSVPFGERTGAGFTMYFDDLELWDSISDFQGAEVGNEPDEFINQLSFTKSPEYKPAHALGPPVEPIENYI